MLPAIGQEAVDVLERDRVIRQDGVPGPDAGADHLRHARLAERREHSGVVLLHVIVPGHRHRSGREVGGKLRILLKERRAGRYIRPEQHALPAGAHQVRHAIQVLEVQGARSNASGGGAARALQFPGLVEADVEPRAGKQRRHLTHPILHHLLHPGIARIQVAAVRQGGQVGISFNPEKIVQVPVEFQARHHVHVTLASVLNDFAHLVLGITAIGIDERVTLQLDRELGVEVVLIALPLREEIDLPLDLSRRSAGDRD